MSREVDAVGSVVAQRGFAVDHALLYPREVLEWTQQVPEAKAPLLAGSKSVALRLGVT